MEQEKQELIIEILHRLQGKVSTSSLAAYHKSLKLLSVEEVQEQLDTIIRKQG